MSVNGREQELCEQIRRDYSPCDVSDALLKLGVPSAGHLADIAPIPTQYHQNKRLAAPVSTILFVRKDHRSEASSSSHSSAQQQSNIPKDKHWTDCPAPGTIAIFQQPEGQIVALLGDIVATRLKSRGVLGAVIDGRVRDIVSCGELCRDGQFQIWSKALSSVGTSMEAKPWAVDVPLKIGGVVVESGDILCADEGERVVCVIPRDKLKDVVELLPQLKEADDAVLKDAQSGVDLATSFRSHRGHYTNR